MSALCLLDCHSGGGGGGAELLTCPYPQKVQVCPLQDKDWVSGLGSRGGATSEYAVMFYIVKMRQVSGRSFAHSTKGRRIDPSWWTS